MIIFFGKFAYSGWQGFDWSHQTPFASGLRVFVYISAVGDVGCQSLMITQRRTSVSVKIWKKQWVCHRSPRYDQLMVLLILSITLTLTKSS